MWMIIIHFFNLALVRRWMHGLNLGESRGAFSCPQMNVLRGIFAFSVLLLMLWSYSFPVDQTKLTICLTPRASYPFRQSLLQSRLTQNFPNFFMQSYPSSVHKKFASVQILGKIGSYMQYLTSEAWIGGMRYLNLPLPLRPHSGFAILITICSLMSFKSMSFGEPNTHAPPPVKLSNLA